MLVDKSFNLEHLISIYPCLKKKKKKQNEIRENKNMNNLSMKIKVRKRYLKVSHTNCCRNKRLESYDCV